MSRASIIKLAVLAILPLLLGLSSGDPSSLSYRLTLQAEPYVDSVTGWMVQNTISKLAGGVAPGPTASPDEIHSFFTVVAEELKAESEAERTSASGPARTASPDPSLSALRARVEAEAPRVERTIQQYVAAQAAKDGLDHDMAGLQFLFPPVYFRFVSLPDLLVTSPRNRIYREGTVLLLPNLTVSEMQKIENRASGPNTSALVTPIGGLGVYPSMVPENSDPRWTIETVAHEWTHQFLALRPLGWRYALGGESDSRMITVNETTAEIVGHELGDQVYHELYPNASPEQQTPSPQQDMFTKEMHRIRTQVDSLLAAGKVQEAESFMEASRQQLAQEGFYIRKLNQAYFAFYGSYADNPSASGGVGQDISQREHELRADSSSLGAFLWKISAAGDYQQFQQITPQP
ncbi:MAG: hypothetical protein M1582_01875 [Actinobacteria bacterium]|nr:hypothetical protein [Actinomycetota bacterium]